ncbi:MAG: DUF4340 domain-containing protein [Candidatus Acidiferrales bacterium]
MIKKSTLIVLLVALLGAGAVYYFDWQRGQKEAAKATVDTSKPAFAVQAQDISSLSISYPADPKAQAIQLAKVSGAWEITSPIQTGADDPAVEGIVEQLATARVSQTEPAAPDRLKAYGLETPAVGLEFQLKNGTKHTLKLGTKDFTGVSVYALADNSKEVALMPESLLVSVDKPLQELRDRAVLHITSDDVNSFELKNSSGEVAASKGKNGWQFSKPASTAGDEDAITSLFTTVANAKMVTVTSETADKLGSYGLTSPAITFTASDARGKSATLLVGKKEGDEYFARDISRPTIFRINQDLYKKLTENYNDLRDTKIVEFDPASITHVEIHNANGTIALTRKSEAEWSFEAPADEKGKSASAEKLFSSLQLARAEEIFDHPTAEVAAKLSKPAFEAILTEKDGKKVTVEISKENGGFVYARSSEGAAVYKLKAQTLTDLNFKAGDMAF